MAISTNGKPGTARNETEERLLDAALTLFATKGFAATSVREIIAATGVTRPVLYYYCDSKQDLFERVVRWKHDDAYHELASTISATSGVADRLRAIIRGTFAFCAADPRVPQLMFQTAFGPVVSELADFLQTMSDMRFGIVAKVMREASDAGELHGGDANSLALLFCSIMDYHANALSRLPNPEQRLTPALADGLVDAFLFGVATGRRKIPQIPGAV
ncbi:MAG: TetR/AcrR family transcriptional regulator [Planctomycetales bacterium]|nr:TetR/AcrR family transcriptional regulator [Planctomycetales bacterium]